jgi:hypothetical protein
MDKTYHKIQTFEQAANQKEYWKTKTAQERLEAAREMIDAAYGEIGMKGLRMEKVLTGIKKRNG